MHPVSERIIKRPRKEYWYYFNVSFFFCVQNKYNLWYNLYSDKRLSHTKRRCYYGNKRCVQHKEYTAEVKREILRKHYEEGATSNVLAKEYNIPSFKEKYKKKNS